MKILIVEDDMTSRNMLRKFMAKYGDCDIAVDGVEALEAFLSSHKENEAFDLIFLDIMMPKIDGIRVLQAIRDFEKEKMISDADRASVIMTTALNDKETVMNSYEIGCDAYAWKPLDLHKIAEVIEGLNLIKK